MRFFHRISNISMIITRQMNVSRRQYKSNNLKNILIAVSLAKVLTNALRHFWRTAHPHPCQIFNSAQFKGQNLLETLVYHIQIKIFETLSLFYLDYSWESFWIIKLAYLPHRNWMDIFDFLASKKQPEFKCRKWALFQNWTHAVNLSFKVRMKWGC